MAGGRGDVVARKGSSPPTTVSHCVSGDMLLQMGGAN